MVWIYQQATVQYYKQMSPRLQVILFLPPPQLTPSALAQATVCHRLRKRVNSGLCFALQTTNPKPQFAVGVWKYTLCWAAHITQKG